MNIILFGFKKCGKINLGMKLAQKLDREFIDSNNLLEELYAAQYHQELSYREIEQKHGFPFFCDFEKNVVLHLLQKKNCVVSLGGGIALNPENISRLQQAGLLIHFKLPQILLKRKILSGDIPHYLDPKNPGDSFDAFYKKRMPIYEQITAHQIDVENKTEDMIIEEISKLIKNSKKRL